MEIVPPADRGDARAFEALLQRHRGIVLKVAGAYARDRHDRDDLAQEIAEQLWRAWPAYDVTRSSVPTWMYRIALNVAISHARGRRRHGGWVPFDERLHDVADGAAADHETRQRAHALRRAIAAQPSLDRALLLLYLEERSVREIADVLGLSESNVTTRIHRLKRRIREDAAPPEHD
ncbi:sigma-70 family RNA polymerase sigma factor [Luteimonas sp. Y-2-2-4F]|nr:sigma-70 family RNA polymerase sigma factor [Luteimonas sp. Y-2-2-4F]MCD9032311.1 sigma-70 family RNA polymerase sigma factor [Luteimonas sp. Y-2-2-4F]